MTWHPDRPLQPQELGQIESWLGVHTEVDPVTFIPLRNRDNDYLIDRALQRSGRSYTGMEFGHPFENREEIQTFAATRAVSQIEEFMANGGSFPQTNQAK